MTRPFFCISYFDGDLSWVESYCGDDYLIYAKGKLPNGVKNNIVMLPNVGYNIYSYLCYIIDNYDALPEMVVFCKNNVFERHVSRKIFEDACLKKTFTPIEEPERWHNINFPVSVISNDGGFLELNNSWYVSKYKRRYFHNFNSYYEFIFNNKQIPAYLRFAPGANYLVPRAHILSRSKNFYINLREFVAHSQFSCESHFVERSLIAIWSSGLNESTQMGKILTKEELGNLAENCLTQIKNESCFILGVKRALMNRVSAFAWRMFH